MVHAPVGVRCPDCAQTRPVPTFDVTPAFLTRGIAAGVLAAAGLGVAISVVLFLLPTIPFLYTVAIAGAGLGIGETISIATNRKRGRKLKVTAALCVVLCVVVVAYVSGGGTTRTIWEIVAPLLGIYLATSRV